MHLLISSKWNRLNFTGQELSYNWNFVSPTSLSTGYRQFHVTFCFALLERFHFGLLHDLFKGLCLKPIKYWCKNQVACLRYTERSVARLQGLDLLLCNQYFNYLCVQHLQIIPLFLWMTYNITLVPYCKNWKVIENWPNNQGKQSTFIWMHTLPPW